jgi:cephalosporin-C deacetylase-like acetyl esterase
MTSPGNSKNSANSASVDSLNYSHFRYAQIARSLKFPVDHPEKWAGWVPESRRKLTELIGLPQSLELARPAPGVKFQPPVSTHGYTRQFVSIETRPGMLAVGWLLVPEKVSGPRPAMICLPGHGRGADEIVGLDEKGRENESVQTYQHNFALQCVRRGYVTLALEMIGFGHRRDAAARKRGAGASSCMPAAGAALMLGESMVGWRVWDVVRTIDFLAGLSDVDSSHIGLMGISGGGTVASYAAALDERVSLAMLSGSFCTFRDSIFSVAHCIDNYVPGILKYFEVADLAAMIAPRLLFCESGSQDDIFPEPGVREAFAESQKTYHAMKSADHIGLDIFNAGHVFDGRVAFDWIKKRWG